MTKVDSEIFDLSSRCNSLAGILPRTRAGPKPAPRSGLLVWSTALYNWDENCAINWSLSRGNLNRFAILASKGSSLRDHRQIDVFRGDEKHQVTHLEINTLAEGVQKWGDASSSITNREIAAVLTKGGIAFEPSTRGRLVILGCRQ